MIYSDVGLETSGQRRNSYMHLMLSDTGRQTDRQTQTHTHTHTHTHNTPTCTSVRLRTMHATIVHASSKVANTHYHEGGWRTENPGVPSVL